ncbi:hypothetical protein LTR99_002940 [Exophiala xenobiotica]|uniref:SHSP domain-containing protein n=1 Tax=Vermiconidia calcicola TaxID=1690605 RepID=A0AAV9Q8Z1_9PEZI|nr:hypothetical protein LTR92_005680 [Exophiala xenobiotica]KAK5538609.1 hypothetical protein LTR25_004151 [Vermiconidia calcicola]KAK5547902.1 hypothetical protein LTR23_002151 [Chaetothyriales sp. CCFEE 6169]KAK5268008.1 hypothetical protein LTR96_006553 [Exophiala xenobiotica]KAK5279587.1 hypothetical protein LTR40_007581 [Exophiala xenobiotica]
MPGLPYAVPANYAIRLVEGSNINQAVAQQHPNELVQPHEHPTHFQFPRVSLHEMTLRTHYHGPHKPEQVSAPRAAGVFAPATDIRETMRSYHIEIETPGVTNKDSILIQWLTPHTLLVQGEAKRPTNIGLLDNADGKRVWEGASGEGWPTESGHYKKSEDGGPLMRTPSRETVEAELMADVMPTVLLSERKVGSWRRTFTLPQDVEMKELRARLDGGLLRIDLPKRSLEDEAEMSRGGIKIEIE